MTVKGLNGYEWLVEHVHKVNNFDDLKGIKRALVTAYTENKMSEYVFTELNAVIRKRLDLLRRTK